MRTVPAEGGGWTSAFALTFPTPSPKSWPSVSSYACADDRWRPTPPKRPFARRRARAQTTSGSEPSRALTGSPRAPKHINLRRWVPSIDPHPTIPGRRPHTRPLAPLANRARNAPNPPTPTPPPNLKHNFINMDPPPKSTPIADPDLLATLWGGWAIVWGSQARLVPEIPRSRSPHDSPSATRSSQIW